MKGFISFICLLSILSLSCSFLKQDVRTPVKRDEVKDGTQVEDAVTKKRIRMLLLKKHYAKTLEVIRKAVKSGRPEVSYGEECVISINGLADEGISDFTRENYDSAGMIFRTIIENYPVDKGLRAGINHSLEETNSYLETCSAKLMDQGLLEYRRGDLETAILTWRKILKFNPEYMDVKKMIETATVQAENLDAIK